MISAKKVVLTSFIVDLLDLVSSVVVMILSGSVVMLAQALEGGADLISSGLLILGLNRSLKRSDKDHPFGHGKELYFWTLISALFTLFVSASLSLYFGWQRIINPRPIHDLTLAYLVLLLTSGTNGYALYLSIKRLKGAYFSSPLIETRATFVLDLMGTLASVLGLVALIIYQVSGDFRFDGLGAMAIGLVLAVMAFILILGVKDLLVGKSASGETEEKVKQATLETSKVKEILKLKTNQIGPEQILVELNVKLENELSTKEIEAVIDQVKQNIKLKVKQSTFIQVEIG